MVSVTTARTPVIYTMIVNCYITNTSYVMNDFVASFIQNGCVTALLQPSEVDCLIAKYFNWQSFFF